MKYDIIGDIHGHAEQLRELLLELEYSDKNGHYRHPDPEKKAIFVGDFIDRGPQIKETLEIVKLMVYNGAALAVLGNHEYNALCFHTKKAGHADAWLRPRNDKNIDQHLETLCQFKNDQKKWKDYLAWFMTLPLFLEIDGIRVVHAAWLPSDIEKLKKWLSKSGSLTNELLQKSVQRDTYPEEFDTIERVLKGVEIPLPKDADAVPDEDGNPRKEIRIRWWGPAVDKTYGEMVFPKKSLKCGKERIPGQKAAMLSAYKNPVPVFFGHYWLKNSKPEIQQENICCLDYSVAKRGSLVAYRWEGEKDLCNDHFISVKVKN